MSTVYWFCLSGGLVVAVVLSLADVLGDALDGAFAVLHVDSVLDPLSLVGGVSVFGGAGVLLGAYTGLGDGAVGVVSGALALAVAVAAHVMYVGPMRRAENSTAFSVREYAGRTGTLSTSVPATGHGEVVVRMGASTTFQTAASFTGEPIPTGARVVVVEVSDGGVLRVAPLGEDEHDPPPTARPPRFESRD